MSRGKPFVRTGLTVARIERGGTSYYGNPWYWVSFDDDSRARTQQDAGFAYGIENPEWRGVPLDVHFTAAGRIAFWRAAQ